MQLDQERTRHEEEGDTKEIVEDILTAEQYETRYGKVSIYEILRFILKCKLNTSVGRPGAEQYQESQDRIVVFQQSSESGKSNHHGAP